MINYKCNLKEIRKEYSITQEELANLIGTTRQTIISLEKEVYTPSLPLAVTISTIFNKDIKEIFEFNIQGLCPLEVAKQKS